MTQPKPVELPLQLPGCEETSAPYGGRLALEMVGWPNTVEWFCAFEERAKASMGRFFLPVYRIADGEMEFLIGARPNWESDSVLRELVAVAQKRVGLRIERGRAGWKLKRPGTSWGETYTAAERRRLKPWYGETLLALSRDGVLAPFLYRAANGCCAALRGPFLQYLERRGIRLTKDNYVPFHFPLWLVAGPCWRTFIEGKRLLVITRWTAERECRVATALRELGAETVQWVPISSGRALLDRIDISAVRRPVDVCLVGAGIGASNVLLQLRELETLCLDVGGYLDCLVDPDRTYHGFIRSPNRSRLAGDPADPAPDKSRGP